ncbi:hypothetical protein GCM10029978_066820 [Actinoallomurus acanthiterrae]
MPVLSLRVDRVFIVTEKLHNVELSERCKGVAWAWAACWSELSLDNPAEADAGAVLSETGRR